MKGSVRVNFASDGSTVVEHSPHHPKAESLSPAATAGTRGLYHITLRTCNVRDAERLCSKIVLFVCLFCQSLSLSWTNTLAYYGICALRIHNVL